MKDMVTLAPLMAPLSLTACSIGTGPQPGCHAAAAAWAAEGGATAATAARQRRPHLCQHRSNNGSRRDSCGARGYWRHHERPQAHQRQPAPSGGGDHGAGL